MLENLPNHLFESIQEFQIFEQTNPLGLGSFGIVRKAKHKLSGRDYAIKIVKVDQTMSEAEVLLLNREIAIHYNLDHPHIIKLWAVLSNKNTIYMIMDCAQNGNLFNFLVRKKGFNEQQSFKLFYQVMEAIDYMHKKDVFHRDIKPENILLDANYNVKLCDFGWVADEINRKRNTFCGTYQYMSPEMVSQKHYDYKIDIWALGVLLYELIHCRAPFPASSIQQIKKRFSSGIYEIKQKASEYYKQLMMGLLQFEPSKRLEIASIKKSKWIKKWTNFALQKSLPSARPDRQISHHEVLTETPQTSKQNLTLKNSHQFQTTKQPHKIKKGHKKFRTLQQQNLYCLGNNILSNKRLITNKQNHKNYLYAASQNRHFEHDNKIAKGLRNHTRTESNDILTHKYGSAKQVLKQSLKMKGIKEEKTKKMLVKKL